MDVMQRRRQLMAMQSELPSAYRRVEYLESSGTQYINSGVIGSIPLEAVATASFAETRNACLLGSRQAATATRFYILSVFNGKWHVGINTSEPSGSNVVANTKYGMRFTIDENGFSLYVNDSLEFTGSNYYSTEFPMFVFAANNYGSAARIAKAKLYSMAILRNGTAERNFIPCVRKSDSKPGMYDTVTKTFYTNAGTGEFIVPA